MSLSLNVSLPSLGFPTIAPPKNDNWIDRSVKSVIELEQSDSIIKQIAAYTLIIIGTLLLGLSVIGIPILIKSFIAYGEERTHIKYQKLINENGLIKTLYPAVAKKSSAVYDRGRELLSQAWVGSFPYRQTLTEKTSQAYTWTQEKWNSSRDWILSFFPSSQSSSEEA